MTAFETFIAAHGGVALAVAAAVMFLGGFGKGVTGFALPMITISGLGAFLPAETAVALLIAPVVVTNVWQSFRGGLGAAMTEIRRHAVLLGVLAPTIAVSAQLLTAIPDQAIFLILGLGVTAFSAANLAGFKPPPPRRAPRATAAGVGLVAGFFGGIAGVWGPPVTLYLLALDTPKVEMVRALGVAFMIGSVVLTGAHLISGVLDASTLPLSLAAIGPAVAGMAIGFAVHDRLPPATFRRVVLAVLVLAGLNLLRRGAGL